MSPTISMFCGIIIRMFWEKSEPQHLPHIYAEYQDNNAVFSIPDGEIIVGTMPKRQARIIQGWIAEHEDELLANWKLAMNNEPLFKIPK
ncbi:MAG: DUF4160 domain-containing protein [Planctomycetaceae bacterium]|nr:DUF4160 domain-containing protein [Planctomycetaceae bacterium]